MLKEIIILFLVGYLISKVLKFIIPIFRVSSAANDHMRRMQEQMQDMQRKMNQNQNQPPQAAPRKKAPKEGDYIDYEEVR